jgi:5-methyltetrahydrofolate--homocysteine methyltransferase
MCIGPNGMAKTAYEKVEVAKLLYEEGLKYNLKPWQYIFDVLTFTLATGESEYADSAKETLEGIKLVKEHFPESFTTLGLSNISFGLPSVARRIVNSVFLYYAIKSGLDTVIINAKDITPINEIDTDERKLAEDLIFNKHPNALPALLSYFESRKEVATTERKQEIDPLWPADRKCHFRILNRVKENIENDVVVAIYERIEDDKRSLNDEGGKLSINLEKEKTHQAAVQVLNDVLLPAMKEVGDKFGAGELILPFVLKSAECMKAAVAELEKYLVKKEGISKGKFVLCTVYGDVHDIGKNLVKTIFVNNGYTVYDLGKQVPLQSIIDKIKEVNADAVGLSALLVSTSKQMQYFVDYALDNDINIPILCGGAAINSNYINRISKKENRIYQPGVFYCKTAFDGLKVMNKLMSNEKGEFINAWKTKIEQWKEKTTAKSQNEFIKSKIVPVKPPNPPHINKIIRLSKNEINLQDIWKYINLKSLFVLSWGIRGKAAEGLSNEADRLFEEWKERVIKEDLFEPTIVYGYFNCQNIDNKLVVDSPNGQKVEFEFPRSSKEKHLCITDYFGKSDIVAFQAVTVGKKVADIIENWNNSGLYTDAYYLHGLAVETAEALAEWINQRIRDELNIGKRGLRYSWGYPSCPDISQHHLVWKLIHPEVSGIELTEAGQIIPDQSTAAIVVHHPEAEYFVL